MTECTDGSVRFGKPGCGTDEICIPRFNAICGFDEPRATDPMTLEAPHPQISIPLPPSDCACFSFKQGDGKVKVKPKADKTPTKFTVEIKQAEDDCCAGRYVVTPEIEVPECPMSDSVKTGTCTLSGLGGQLNWTIKWVDCEPILEMSGNIPVPRIALPVCNTEVKGEGDPAPQPETASVPGAPPVRAMRGSGSSAFGLSVTLPGGDVTYATFPITEGTTDDGCPCYTLGNATLDLSGIAGGGGGGGGGGGEGGGGIIVIPGKGLGLDSCPTAAPTWLAGGMPPPCIGENPSANVCLLSSDSVESAFDCLDSNCCTLWTSCIPVNDDDPQRKRANFQLTLPSGVQSSNEAIAFTFTRTLFNSYGLLSEAEEEDYNVLVAPPPMTDGAGNAAGGIGSVYGTAPDLRCGLHVKAGEGLRVNGIDNPPDEVTEETRKGTVEVKFGPGFKVRTGRGDAAFDTAASTEVNALYLNYKWGLTIPAVDRTGTENELWVNYGKGLTIPKKDDETGEEKLQVKCGYGLGFKGAGETDVSYGGGGKDAVAVYHGRGLCIGGLSSPKDYGTDTGKLEVLADTDDFEFGTGDKANMLKLKSSDFEYAPCMEGCGNVTDFSEGLLVPVIMPNYGKLFEAPGRACMLTPNYGGLDDPMALFDGLRIQYLFVDCTGRIRGIYSYTAAAC